MNTSFQSPIQKKDISTISDYGYSESNDRVDTISYSKEKVDPSSNTRLDIHITNGIHNSQSDQSLSSQSSSDMTSSQMSKRHRATISREIF